MLRVEAAMLRALLPDLVLREGMKVVASVAERMGDRGIIVLFEWPEWSGEEQNTIAHEYRHHWQCAMFGRWNGKPLDLSLGYEAMLRKHFEQPHERDAQRFAHRREPTAMSHYWNDMTQGSLL